MKASDKAQIMYTGYDSLKFLHNGIDTILFIGRGVHQYFDVEAGTGGDCPGPNKRRDEYTINYQSSQYNSVLTFTYGIPLNGQYGTQLVFDFDQSSFYNQLIDLTGPWAFNSLQIATNIFTNIVLFDPTRHSSDSLYFNSQYGILRMSTNNNTSKWELIK